MNVLSVILIAILIVAVVIFSWFKGWKESTPVVGALIAALFFANIERFKYFKGGGIEAELQTAVNKAYAAVGPLKDLGLSLSAPIVNEVAMSGYIGSTPLKEKLERVARISADLKALKASDVEIARVVAPLYQRVTSQHVGQILAGLRIANPGKDSLFDELREEKWDTWDVARIDRIIKANGLSVDAKSGKLIKDLDFFLKNKQLRREEFMEGLAVTFIEL